MITRTHRFHGLNSLRYVYNQGQTVRGPLLAVRYSLNSRRRDYRAAVVVSRKVHKSAVTRNRIRRRIYEIIRRHEPAISHPYDIVVTVFHEQVATMDAHELEQTIVGLLIKASIISHPANSVGHAIVEPKESS